MIESPTQSFYIITASGEAAELITATFSIGTMADIVDVIVLSKEFSNDIEPINEMDTTLETIKEGLGSVFVEHVKFNPLFIPMKMSDLDDALEVESKNDNISFMAMNGDPFAIKIVELAANEEPLITATVRYHQFDLPSYEDIMKNQSSLLLN